MDAKATLMSRATRLVSTVALLALTLPGCGSLNLIPVSRDSVLGAQSYPELLANDPIISSGKDYEMVARMTDNLVAAAKELDPEIADLFEWEVRLVKRDDIVNAWCLPGGKMAVYTGILPVAQGETGLAVVMGHEIAHATLRHGTQKMTRQMGTAALVAITAIAVGDNLQEKALAAGIASAAASFVNLSYGRGDELEADARGLKYMARAGYDPREAVDFWKRMQAASGGKEPPQWLSTHPSNSTRIEQIEELLPEALAIYQQSGGSN
ncbi:MAG: M48 family metallopeptidase [Planctomycetota bacterium]